MIDQIGQFPSALAAGMPGVLGCFEHFSEAVNDRGSWLARLWFGGDSSAGRALGMTLQFAVYFTALMLLYWGYMFFRRRGRVRSVGHG